MTSQAQHKAQIERTAAFARIIRDLQEGAAVDLSVESTFSLQDMEFQAELCKCPIAQNAILAELDKRESAKPVNPHSLSPYKTYTVTFQAFADDDCIVVVHGVSALSAESATLQAAQIFKGVNVFKVVAVQTTAGSN